MKKKIKHAVSKMARFEECSKTVRRTTIYKLHGAQEHIVRSEKKKKKKKKKKKRKKKRIRRRMNLFQYINCSLTIRHAAKQSDSKNAVKLATK